MTEKEKLSFIVDSKRYQYGGLSANKKRDFYLFALKQKYDNQKIISIYRQNFDDNLDDENILYEYNNYCVKKIKKSENEINDDKISPSYTKDEYDEINKFINFIIADKSQDYKIEQTVNKFTIYLSLENINNNTIIFCYNNTTYDELCEKIKQKINKNVMLYFKDDDNIINVNDDDSFEIFKNLNCKKKLYYSFSETIKFNNYNNKKTLNYRDNNDDKLLHCKLSDENIVMCWKNRDIIVANINTGKKVSHDALTSAITSCDYSKNLILLSSESGNIRQFDVNSKKYLSKFKIENKSDTVCFCKYNILCDKFVLSTMESNIIVYNAENNSELYKMQNKSISFFSKFIDDFTYISGFMSGLISMTDMRDKKQIFCIDGHNSKINYLSYSTDKKIMASCSTNGEIKLWDMRNSQICLDTIKLCDGSIKVVDFIDDNYLVSCDKLCVKIYDIQKKSTVHELYGHCDEIIDLHLFNKQILSASCDGTIKSWTTS
jgi:WD40 repeat protein